MPTQPRPFCPLVTYSRVQPPSFCVVPCSFCPHIPAAMIDLGRCSPSLGRTASKISLEALPNRDKADFRRPTSATGDPARRRVSGISVQGAGVEAWIYRPTEVSRSVVGRILQKSLPGGGRRPSIYPECGIYAAKRTLASFLVAAAVKSTRNPHPEAASCRNRIGSNGANWCPAPLGTSRRGGTR